MSDDLPDDELPDYMRLRQLADEEHATAVALDPWRAAHPSDVVKALRAAADKIEAQRKFIFEMNQRRVALKQALEAWVRAHETGRYEPSQQAYNAARIVLDLDGPNPPPAAQSPPPSPAATRTGE